MSSPIFIKDPDAELDYIVDWSAWLVGDDTIDTVAWEAPEDLTVEDSSNTDTTAKVWLSGGTRGRRHKVICRVTTVEGRTDDRTLQFRIAER